MNKKDFEDIVVFSMSEAGSMGPNDMTFYKKGGESFTIDYKSEETPYSELRECFPLLKECYWNGPMKSDSVSAFTIVIGGSEDDKETHVPEGWRHIYLDYGNHLIVKKELYYEVKNILSDNYREGKTNCDVIFTWVEMLDKVKFWERIDEIEKAYHEMVEKDRILADKLDELKGNQEYIEKVKAAGKDLEKMMDVLEEYSGIRMTWLELKQFGFRQNGWI